eukprot:SAG31_NODE_147_length_22539_cov_37.073663_12_plen_164_part_00
MQVYEVKDKKLTPSAVAYVRARNADPLCSFGDFAALSEVVDVDTATFLKTEVSDGIIAPVCYSNASVRTDQSMANIQLPFTSALIRVKLRSLTPAILQGFEPEALAILSSKKGGSFIVLEGKVDFPKPDLEYREVHGAVLAQKRNGAPAIACHGCVTWTRGLI